MHHTEPLIFPCRRRDAVQSRSAPIFKYHPSPPPFVTRFLFRSYPLLSSPSPRGGRRKNGRKKRRSFARLISNERHTLSLSPPLRVRKLSISRPNLFNGRKERPWRANSRQKRESFEARKKQSSPRFHHLSSIADDRTESGELLLLLFEWKN